MEYKGRRKSENIDDRTMDPPGRNQFTTLDTVTGNTALEFKDPVPGGDMSLMPQPRFGDPGTKTLPYTGRGYGFFGWNESSDSRFNSEVFPEKSQLTFFADAPSLVSAEQADIRSQKYAFGSGLDPEETRKDILSDREKLLREKTARTKTLEDEQLRLDILRDFTSGEGPVTKEQAGLIDSIITKTEWNPNTVLEQDYAEKIFSELHFKPDGKSLQERADDIDPVISNSLYDVATDNVARMEVIRKKFEDLGGEYDKLSLPAKVGDFLEGLIPFKSWTNISNDETYGDFLGKSISRQVTELYSLPTVDEFERELSARVDEIAKSNINDARYFLEAVLSYSSSDELLDQVFSGIDILSIPGGAAIGRAVGRTASAARAKDILKDLAQKNKNITQSLGKDGYDVPEVLSAGGKSEAAVKAQVSKNLRDEFYGKRDALVSKIPEADVSRMKSILSHTPSFMDPYRLFKKNFKMDAAVANRVFDTVQEVALLATRSIANRSTLERLPIQAEKEAIDAAYELAKKEFTHASNAVMDVEHLPAELSPANVHSIAVTLKKPNGDAFPNRENAEYFAETEYKLPSDYDIIPTGEGYVLKVIRDVDETNPKVRDSLIGTDNVTPASYANTFLGALRGANNLLPTSQNQARKRLVHGQQEMFKIAKEMAKPLKKLSSDEQKRFLRFTEYNRDKPRKDINGEVRRGDFYTSLADLEQEWQNVFNRLPTENEAKAYFSYVKFYEWDYALRNLAIYREKARQGISSMSIRMPEGSPSAPPKFEGKFVDNLDIGSQPDNAGFLFWDPKASAKEFFSKSDLTGEFKKATEEAIKNEGYRVLQIANPFSRPLKDATEVSDVINYVITKEFDNTRLPFEQIPYRPGGHVAYDYGYYLKQPNVQFIKNRRLYFGDTTLRGVETEAKAKTVLKNYEEARRLYNIRQEKIKTKKSSAAETQAFMDFVEKNLPEKPEALITMFRNGRLDPSAPITMVRSGRRTIDDRPFRDSLGAFEDTHESSFNLTKNVNKEFAGERGFDLHGFEGGTEAEPLFKLESPKLIDPLTTLDNAVNSMVKNEFFGDYRTLAVEHFIEEFYDVMNVSKESLRNNPFAALYKPNWNTHADPKKLAAAKNFQRATMDLLGVRTQTSRNLVHAKEKMYEAVFNKYGDDAADHLQEHALSKINDPISGARAFVFKLKLGLFSLPQVYRQAQTVVHALALSPRYGLQAANAYSPMRLALANESWVDSIAEKVGRIPGSGFTKENFKEAYELLQKTGIMNVEGEHIWKDDLSDPKLVRNNPLGTFFDKGDVFFRSGERISRISAFNAAYLEWRGANPGLKLTRREADKILLRQDNMNVNMTHASRAAWQKGLLSFPTQFLSYQIRLWEQMLGKNLTSAEKLRVGIMYSAFYGVPIGIGGTMLPVWPWYEDIRKHMLEQGYEWDNKIAEVFHTGFVQTFMHWVTGQEYQYGEQLGPQGVDIFKDILSGDPKKTILTLMFGPTGSTVSDIMATSYPALKSLQQIFVDGPDEGNLKVAIEDLNGVARNAASWNYAWKMYTGLRIGQIVSKIEGYTSDVTNMDSIMIGTLGLNPRDLGDAYVGIESLQDRSAYQKEMGNQIIKYLRRGWKAQAEGQDAEAIANFKMAKVYQQLGNFDPTEYGDIIGDASKNYESLIDSINNRLLENQMKNKMSDF